MLKKSFLAIVFVAIGIFVALGTSQAYQLDGMVTVPTTGTSVSPAIPSGGTSATTLHMFVDPGGVGQALIYGYYNARGAWDFIRVVNTSSVGVGAKVRFREGRNSNEVLDFGICLSAHDQWTAWIIGDTDPKTPATLYVYDSDTPMYPSFGTSVALKYKDTGAAKSITADDTKEGYFEIIGAVSWSEDTKVYGHVTTAAECQAVLTTDAAYQMPPYNSLFGNAYIFDVTGPMVGTYAYNATALSNFTTNVIPFSLQSDSSPRLDDADDINGNSTGLDEVNYVLTKWQEYATYDIETWWKGDTTIINTFPTKKLTIAKSILNNGPFNHSAHVCKDGTIGTYDASTAEAVTLGNCSPTDTKARCEQVGVKIYNDKEETPTTTSGVSPGETTVLEKCDEVSLITVGTTSTPVLATNLNQFNITAPAGYTLGWVLEDFIWDNDTLISLNRYTALHSTVAYGLPVISHELQNVGGGLSHMLPLRYRSLIQELVTVVN